MELRMAKQRQPKRRAWDPLRRGPINPSYRQLLIDSGEDVENLEVWGSDLYQVTVRRLPTTSVATGEPSGEMLYLSIKRNDRHAIRDWRHLQQIKNEIAGPEREAVEVFPAESRLVDTANEYHLWVLPEGERVPCGYSEREVREPAEIRAFNAEQAARGPTAGKARQRPWQPGLTTGRD